MIFDGLPFEEYARRTANARLTGIVPLVDLFERRTGARVLYPQRISLERPDLTSTAAIASLLIKNNIIRQVRTMVALADEPPINVWIANSRVNDKLSSSGASTESDESALRAALAESVERYVWLTQTDYFDMPVRAMSRDMTGRGPFIPPERFAGFSAEDRANHRERQLTSDAEYLWIRGTSLVTGEKIYIPAQVGSGAVRPAEYPKEPVIRQQNSIGLGTWPTLAGARLAGALEVIEREAYMVMWLNQLTVPKIKLAPVRESSSSLDTLVERCERYRLKVHLLHMPTDAPTHAICAVIEDMSNQAPRFTFGLKVHRSLAVCAEKSILEALRIRRGYRLRVLEHKKWDSSVPIDKMDHDGRFMYWGEPANARHLEFLIAGKEVSPEATAWETDTIEQHLARIADWCRANSFECVAVSLGASKGNPTPFQIEMVVMPDLQPPYLEEYMRQFGCVRRVDLAKRLGYTPRKEPYIDRPHPLY